MSFRRYEILLPTRYNDGSKVEREKYWQTAGDLVAEFGASTYQPATVLGTWTHEGRRYEEENVRIYVDVEDTPETAAFFARLKQLLKQRFRQIDIWIVSYEIRIT